MGGIRRFVELTLHPDWYHGHEKKPPFFEGWYYKLVSADERKRYAIIPGIFLGEEEGKTHAFVQVLDGVTSEVTYHRYPAEAFWAARDALDVRVGPNRFTRDHIHLAIERPERTVVGEVSFTGLVPWPVTLTAPGIMGWYAWMPFMETYHGVVSLDHELHGGLTVDGEHAELAGGRGYIEKDWGQAFPEAWVWFQTQHFDRPGTCVTASIALIPWLFHTFRGFIIGVWHAGKLHRFATYTGAETERLRIEEDHVDWVVRDREYRLEMHARRTEAGGLKGPSRADMDVRVPETLQATVDVRLTERSRGEERVVFAGSGRNAGLEVGGDWQKLVD